MVNLESKRLDHLGLVAGICQELDIAGTIDRLIPSESPDKILSTGTGVVAMILNGLGFVNKRLYLTPFFFEGKPVDKLLGVSYLESDHLNDDALGRCLDALDNHSVDILYSALSHRAVNYLVSHCGLKPESFNMDNTNFSLCGQEKSLVEGEEVILEITQGHSKDHRPDLVQIGLQLITESRSGIPLLMRTLSGNQEESKSYGETIQTHISELNHQYGALPLVGDSKLYTKDNLGYLTEQKGLTWITRVPATVLKNVLGHISEDSFTPLNELPNYSFLELGSNYGGVNQKWVVYLSQDLRKTQQKQVVKRFEKGIAQEQKGLAKLSRQKFHCPTDAQDALDKYQKKLKYSLLEDYQVTTHHRYAKKGKPAQNEKPKETFYRIKSTLKKDEQAYQKALQLTGYFVLATNELTFKSTLILEIYKNQKVPEKSFRFLKDPKVVASSLFVQKPQRMRAMLMIMTLCLLVYATLEYKIRCQLRKIEQNFRNQVGKPIQNPTLNWIFFCFEGIEILYQREGEKMKKLGILNLKEQHRQILALLGDKYWHFYT